MTVTKNVFGTFCALISIGIGLYLGSASTARADYCKRLANESSTEAAIRVIAALLPMAEDAHRITSLCQAQTRRGDLDRWIKDYGLQEQSIYIEVVQCCQTFNQTFYSKVAVTFTEKLKAFVGMSVPKAISDRSMFKIATKIADKAAEKAKSDLPNRMLAQAEVDWGATNTICAGPLRRHRF